MGSRGPRVCAPRARKCGGWSPRRASNPRPPGWKPGTLPTELLGLGADGGSRTRDLQRGMLALWPTELRPLEPAVGVEPTSGSSPIKGTHGRSRRRRTWRKVEGSNPALLHAPGIRHRLPASPAVPSSGECRDRTCVGVNRPPVSNRAPYLLGQLSSRSLSAASPAGVEPAASRLEDGRSVQLSYEDVDLRPGSTR